MSEYEGELPAPAPEGLALGAYGHHALGLNDVNVADFGVGETSTEKKSKRLDKNVKSTKRSFGEKHSGLKAEPDHSDDESEGKVFWP